MGRDALQDSSGSRYQPIDPGTPLKGPTTQLVDPAAIEAAGLRGDLLPVDGAAVNSRGHHGDRASDRPEARGGVQVAPGGLRGDPRGGH